MPNEENNLLPPHLRALLRTARLRATRSLHASRKSLTAVEHHARRTVVTLRNHANTVLNHPQVSARLTDDYIRGGVEFLTTAVVLTSLAYATYRGLVTYRTAQDIPYRLVRRGRVLHGVVASVRDGDGVRVRHVPFLRRVVNDYRVPRVRRMAEETISVRLAAVDAPESAQRYGKLAREWLKKFALGRRVSIRMHSVDRYNRVIATVHAKHANPILRAFGLGRKNLSLELTRAGYATLYEGAGAQYGGERMKRLYMAVEAAARRKRIGMWADKKYVSPMDFKKAIRDGNLSALVAKSNGKVDKRLVIKQTAKSLQEDQPPESLLTALYKFAVFSYQYLRKYR